MIRSLEPCMSSMSNQPIYTGVACYSDIMKDLSKVRKECLAEMSFEFHRIWYKNNVFCFGRLSSIKWKLSPLQNDLTLVIDCDAFESKQYTQTSSISHET